MKFLSKRTCYTTAKLFICMSLMTSFATVKIAAASTSQNVASIFASDESDPVVEITRTGQRDDADEVRGALAFRVKAFVDDGSGNARDGDGIRNVLMIVQDNDNNDREVVRHTETSAGYCAFGGGEPNCNVYNFAKNNNRWPNGDPIRSGGRYTLLATVTANNGRQSNIGRSITIKLADEDNSEGVDANVVLTGQSDNDEEVRGALAFRVRASVNDGTGRDGDGIRNVFMIVKNNNTRRDVVRHNETNAGYCAFGGGEPNCNVYDFAKNKNRWPNGDPIRRGDSYTLIAIINTTDGRTRTINTSITIR